MCVCVPPQKRDMFYCLEVKHRSGCQDCSIDRLHPKSKFSVTQICLSTTLIDTKKQFFLVLTTQAISTQIIKHIRIFISYRYVYLYMHPKNTYIYIFMQKKMPNIYIYIHICLISSHFYIISSDQHVQWFPPDS